MSYRLSASRSIPTSTDRSVRSSSQSISSSAKVRVLVPPVAADRVGAVEVGEQEDVEQLGGRSRTERVEALLQSALDLLKIPEAYANSRDRLELLGQTVLSVRRGAPLVLVSGAVHGRRRGMADEGREDVVGLPLVWTDVSARRRRLSARDRALHHGLQETLTPSRSASTSSCSSSLPTNDVMSRGMAIVPPHLA